MLSLENEQLVRFLQKIVQLKKFVMEPYRFCYLK